MRTASIVLVANHLCSGMRSVGFVQHAGGVRVDGGQVSFRFKNDRLGVAIRACYRAHVTLELDRCGSPVVLHDGRASARGSFGQ